MTRSRSPLISNCLRNTAVGTDTTFCQKHFTLPDPIRKATTHVSPPLELPPRCHRLTPDISSAVPTQRGRRHQRHHHTTLTAPSPFFPNMSEATRNFPLNGKLLNFFSPTSRTWRLPLMYRTFLPHLAITSNFF